MGIIKYGLQRLEGSGKKALSSGKGWLLIEDTLPKIEGSKAVSAGVSTNSQPTTPNRGTASRIYEDEMSLLTPGSSTPRSSTL